MPSGAARQLPASGRLVDDAARFRAVFERHYPTVVRALKRVSGSDAEAEDLAQETFVSLGWHRFPAGRSHNLRAWLLRTAMHVEVIRGRGWRGHQMRTDHRLPVDPPPVTPSRIECAVDRGSQQPRA